MSVAFRRESDEEHLEPKFERPIPPGPNLVTPRGLALLGEAVAAGEARLEAATDDRDAAARDLRYWRTRLATAQLAPPPAEGEAGIGSRVRFRLGGREQEVEIVGTDEAAPEAGRIGFLAPLARAMAGAAEGDVLGFGGKPDAIEILAVIAPSP